MKMPMRRFKEIHSQERGALAMLCLAGILIIVMMGLLVMDVAEVSQEKAHIQAAADASAHSQAAVMARTMNMISFANVGKRINVGYVAGYDAVMGWLGFLNAVAWILTAICGVLIPLTKGLITPVCKQMARISAAASCVYALEHFGDRRPQWEDVVRGTFGPEIRAYNNYQQYMADITPYWAWSAGVWRGFTNSAPVTVGYPAPKASDNFTAALPIRVPEGNSWDNMCEKIQWAPSLPDSIGAIMSGGPAAFFSSITRQADRWYMFFDFMVKNVLGAVTETSSLDTDQLGDMPDGVDLGDDGIEGDTDLDFEVENCGQLEDILSDCEDCDYIPPVPCPEPDPDDEDPPECEDQEGSVRLEGATEYINVGMDCATSELNEALNDAIQQVTNSLSCSNIDSVGMYGAVFLSGALGLLVDPTQILDGRSGFIWRIIRRLLPRSFRDRCGGQTQNRYGDFAAEAAAWELDSSANWLMQGSTLMYAYRPNAHRNMGARTKYDFVGAPAEQGLLDFGSSGTWAMSRGEIAWQGDRDKYNHDPIDGPHLWESVWASRIRPVALDGEWESYGDFTPWDGLQEIQREMIAGILLAHGMDFLSTANTQNLLTKPYNVESISIEGGMTILEEIFSTYQSFEPMTDERMDGVVK